MSEFRTVCALDDVPLGGVLAAVVDGTEVAVVRTADEVFAIRDECSHAAIALSEGEVDAQACEIECWLHGSRFDLRTGKPTGLPAIDPVPVYPCRVEAGQVTVDILHPRDVEDVTGESIGES
ncbi:MAG: non-heme iron oxygenase ferredoxin subunit [Nocardioidaceae bacterium]